MLFIITFYKNCFSCDPLIRDWLQGVFKQKVVNACLAHDCNKIYTFYLVEKASIFRKKPDILSSTNSGLAN